jgi:hypothetical protein
VSGVSIDTSCRFPPSVIVIGSPDASFAVNVRSALIASAEAFLYADSAILLLRRLAR